MNDSLGALLAIAVLWLILRFAFGGSSSSSNTAAGAPSLDAARGRQVPQHMVDAVKTLFPHIPEASIRYDLQRSGSAEATCDRILNEGGLPTPPPGFFGTTPATPPDARRGTTAGAGAGAAAGTAIGAGPIGPTAAPGPASSITPNPTGRSTTTLLSRFGTSKNNDDEDAGSKTGEETSGWAATAEERSKKLEERKRRMVMEARQRMMAKRAEKNDV